jgi:hypothetical protein
MSMFRPFRHPLWSALLAMLAMLAFLGGSAAAANRAPLAIKGYDPVAYFTMGKPVRGLPQHEYEWDDQRYQFLNAAHLALFKADPVRYAPQFRGLCAMALANGEIVEGNPQYWTISNNALYIFGKPLAPGQFDNPQEIISRAARNLPRKR